MDYEILRALNAWAASNSGVSWTFFLFTREVLKNLLPIVLFWGLWFSFDAETRQTAREKLVGVLLIGAIAIGVARGLATVLPFRTRPMHDPEAGISIMGWLNTSLLEEWSAFPSDHAVLFFALAVGLFQVSKRAGVVALLHAGLIVCLPRVAVGLHWPSDIAVGILIGIALSVLLFRPVQALVHKSGLVPFFEAREAIGYPLLFLATYELSRMFHSVRQVMQFVWE
nr:phosphatase PAP2 family protein [Roseovarius sp. W115]